METLTIMKLSGKVRNAELDGYATNMLESYANAPALAEDTSLKGIVDELFQVTHDLTEALEREKVLSRLKTFDTARDKAFKDFFTFIKGNLPLTEASQYPAVEAIYKILDKYGLSSTTKSYDAQTGLFNSLMDELKQEEIQSVLPVILYAQKLYDALVEAHENFIKEYANYVGKMRVSQQMLSASNIKPKVMNVINNKLVTYLRAQVVVDAETYAAFAGEIALIINRANQIIKERSDKGGNDDDGDAEE